jgi:chromosome segregation ATPase
LKDKLETERAERVTQLTRVSAQSLQLEELRAELERVRIERADAQSSYDALEASLGELRGEIERERAQSADGATVIVAREAELEDLRAELERERGRSSARKVGLAEVEATLAEVQAEVETKQLQIAASTKAIAVRDAELSALREALESERAARGTLETQLAAATVPPSVREAAQQEQLETLRACLLELRLPLLDLDSELTRISQGKSRSAEAGETPRKIIIDLETLSALDEQIRQKDLKIEELEGTLAAEQKARIAAQSVSPAERDARVVARDTSVATLKGELIDVRANATRLSDDLTRERTRRRKMAVTLRALQAASESGESLGPWIEELMSLINEGSSLPPKSDRQ